MNRDWMREKLQQFSELAGELAGLRRADEAMGGEARRQALFWELCRREPTINRILEALNLPRLNLDIPDGLDEAVNAQAIVMRALGILADRDDWTTANLGPGRSVLERVHAMEENERLALPANRLHPWVWAAARPLLDAGQFRQAVQAAATAINARTQRKLRRQDVADDKLMQEVFSDKPAGPGRYRLRCPGDSNNPTVQSRQRGALQYAVGCFFAIRNPATHEHAEWDQQIALEYLAALSVLARWIDDWKIAIRP
jgi:hypothetical protein